ncbi:MAG: tRNA pseudouridine(38-40) synthase TruA [Alphaproteobacteria bacterium]|nr:tRNA pseudouridine(38-40) synthase TruA [Alphaproteobacteria bacterium]
MMRYAVLLEYDGGGFVGWQRQENGLGVQEALETALLRLTGEPIVVQAAGRTDAGVHAAGQVANFDLSRPWEPRRIVHGLNHHLRPHRVAVLAAERVPPDFSARFSALSRHYRYQILTREAPAILRLGRVWWLPRELELEPMREAAALLLGTHDFTSFRAAQCQARSPIKSLTELAIDREACDGGLGSLVTVTAAAPSFLHHQVRNMVGSLVQVGLRRWPVARMAEALHARDRSQAGETAPPQGLCLMRVQYPVLMFGGSDSTQ